MNSSRFYLPNKYLLTSLCNVYCYAVLIYVIVCGLLLICVKVCGLFYRYFAVAFCLYLLSSKEGSYLIQLESRPLPLCFPFFPPTQPM